MPACRRAIIGEGFPSRQRTVLQQDALTDKRLVQGVTWARPSTWPHGLATEMRNLAEKMTPCRLFGLSGSPALFPAPKLGWGPAVGEQHAAPGHARPAWALLLCHGLAVSVCRSAEAGHHSGGPREGAPHPLANAALSVCLIQAATLAQSTIHALLRNGPWSSQGSSRGAVTWLRARSPNVAANFGRLQCMPRTARGFIPCDQLSVRR